MFKRNPQFIVHFNSETGVPPIPIFEKRFIVGRKPTHLVAIPDNSISRDHLEVIFQDSQIFVMDLETSNGTKLDGHKIPSNIQVPYQQGQVIWLGHSNVSLTIELFEEDREKRKNNPSAKAMQQLSNKGYQSFPDSAAASVTQQPAVYNTAPQSQPIQTIQTVQSAKPIQTIQTVQSAKPVQTVQPYQPVQQQQLIAAQPINMAQPYAPVQTVQPAQPQIIANPESMAAPLTQQSREDANRIIAKAKIEAEMATRDLLRNKEGEAQALIQQAETKALEKIRDAEGQVQTIIQHANAEGQKVKDAIVEEAHREKDRVLATINAEKEMIQRDIETLKQTVPNLSGQIDHLKLQIQKYQTEKVTAESQFTQETIRLEKLLSEIKNQELQLKNFQQQLELNLIKANDAEEKYKATVIANQTLVDETKAALERAKVREAEFDSLIESAKTERDSAVEFATGHRADAESYAKMMREEADSYARVTREETDRWSASTREETEKWAATTRQATELDVRKKLDQLQQETTKIVEERDRVYQEMKQRQETILDELKNTESVKLKNLQEIDDILRRKSEEFESAFRTRREGLENEYTNRRAQIERETLEKRDTLERELSDRRTSIERELLERREALERESTEKKAIIEREAQELRATRDKEYKELKTQQDAYLMDVKKREEDRLKAMVEESRRVIREQFNIKNENVQKTFNEFFSDYIKTSPVSMRDHLPNLHSQLNKLLKEALTNELTGEDKQLRQLYEYDPNIEQKHKKFWIKFAAIGAVVLATIIFILRDPKKISEGAEAVTATVNNLDQENKKNQAAMLEQIKQAGIYRPDQDVKFKDSYTDNVLYTSRYVEFEKDDQYRNQWIVATKEFFIQEAKLIDDKADEIISKEGSLIIALEREVPTIDGRNPEKGIMRMREKESEYLQLLTQTLSNEIRQALKEKKQAFYERYINDPAKTRGPADSGQ